MTKAEEARARRVCLYVEGALAARDNARASRRRAAVWREEEPPYCGHAEFCELSAIHDFTRAYDWLDQARIEKYGPGYFISERKRRRNRRRIYA